MFVGRVDLERQYEGNHLEVTVHGQQFYGIDQGDEAARWFRIFLGVDCRLVVFDPLQPPRYDRKGIAWLSFADADPELIISDASLDDLNRHCSRKNQMKQFRPNITVAGSEPYAEDRWGRIRIGQYAEFEAGTRCIRCVIPTIDPDTAETGNKEPTATLAKLPGRRVGKDVFFGRNFSQITTGLIRVGDPVEVLA